VSNYEDSYSDQAIYDKIIKARVKSLIHMPFFGILLSHLTLCEQASMPTMATDGIKIYYSPTFVTEHLNDKELAFVLLHEVLHVALGSLWRRGDRDFKLWNLATDYAINGLLKDSITGLSFDFMEMPKQVLYEEQFKDKCAEEIYDILIKNYQADNENGDNDTIEGLGNLGDLIKRILDDHDRWDEAEVQENKEQKVDDWARKLTQVGKVSGSVPQGVKRYIDELLTPKKDWRQELREFVIKDDFNDYSFTPPDRRYGDLSICGHEFYLPDLNEKEDRVKDLVAWVDTSGSIDYEELKTFYSELVGAINQLGGKLSGHIGFFDHEVYGLYPFETEGDLLDITPTGGGGTSFEAFLNRTHELEEQGELKISGVIVFTDGYCDYPKENPVKAPMLWLYTDKKNTIPDDSFGRAIYVD
jgi:predicted metal-dependent peptidase